MKKVRDSFAAAPVFAACAVFAVLAVLAVFAVFSVMVCLAVISLYTENIAQSGVRYNPEPATSLFVEAQKF